MKRTVDVIIIGGGIAGASVAYHLAQAQGAGLEVMLLEQRTPASGTTGKSVAMLEFQFPTAMDIRLRCRSLATYRRFFREPDSGVHFHQTGGILLASSPLFADLLRGAVTLQQKWGLTAEWLEPQDLKARVPAIFVDDLKGASYCAEDGYVDPYRLVMALMREAQRHGVGISTGTTVTGIWLERGRVRGVMTNRGPIAARWVVNAAGPWAKHVAAMAGLNIPLAHTKCQIWAVRPHTPFPYAIPWVLDRQSEFYLRQDTAGVVLLGRLVQAFDADQQLNPDAYVGFSQQPDEAFSAFVSRCVEERIPALAESEVIRGWVGLRAVTPDARPLLGETPVKGFLLAAGLGGYGIQLGAVAGEMLAQLILGKQPEELRLWSFSRFSSDGQLMEKRRASA